MGVVMETFQFVGNRDDSDSGGSNSNSGGYEQSSPPKRQAAAEKPSASGDFSADEDTLDEDVPF
jgi:single-stranded DNA-binding protein